MRAQTRCAIAQKSSWRAIACWSRRQVWWPPCWWGFPRLRRCRPGVWRRSAIARSSSAGRPRQWRASSPNSSNAPTRKLSRARTHCEWRRSWRKVSGAWLHSPSSRRCRLACGACSGTCTSPAAATSGRPSCCAGRTNSSEGWSAPTTSRRQTYHELARATSYFRGRAHARPLLDSSVSRLRRVLGDEHPAVAGALLDLALATEDLDVQRALLDRSHEIRRRSPAATPMELAASLHALAGERFERREYVGAATLFRETLRLL